MSQIQLMSLHHDTKPVANQFSIFTLGAELVKAGENIQCGSLVEIDILPLANRNYESIIVSLNRFEV